MESKYKLYNICFSRENIVGKYRTEQTFNTFFQIKDSLKYFLPPIYIRGHIISL